MKVSSYPGCSLEGAALDYAASIPGVTPLPELELAELEDWNCCGPGAAPSVNHHLSLALGRPRRRSGLSNARWTPDLCPRARL
jgi:heterodisulfide reductase subunit B